MRQVIYHPLFVIVISILFIILSISLYINSRDISQSSEQLQFLQNDVKKSSSDVAAAEEKLKNAQTPFAREQVYRNELLLQKPGETVIQIPDLSGPSPTPVLPSPSLSPWEAWQKVLF